MSPRRLHARALALITSAITVASLLTGVVAVTNAPPAQATTPLLEFQRDAARASWVSGPGGNYFGVWECPQGSLAVGVRGTEASGYVYAFGLVCRYVDLNTGTWGQYAYTSTTHANPSTQLLCPSGQALVRVDVRTMSTFGYPIASETEPYCQFLDFGDVTASPRQIPQLTGTVSAAPSRFFGAASGSFYGRANCGAGKFVVAIDGRRGALLDGLGIYCGGFTARAATISGVSLSGSTQFGLPVTATPTAAGGPAPTMTYQWYRCQTADATPDTTIPAPPECELITGATSGSYLPQISDTGKHLRVAATATNYFGTATLVSATTPAPSVPAPSLDLAAASDSGTSTTDNHTSDSTPTLHLGQLVPTALVEVSATNGSTTVTCTAFTARGIPDDERGAPASGQCDLPPLSEGAWTVTTRQTYTPDGGSAVTSTSTTLPIVVDTTPPIIGTIVVKNGTTTIGDGDASAASTTNTFTLTTPTATDAHTGVVITCSIDGGAYTACPTSYRNLAAGEHTLTVKAVDKAGNESTRTHSWVVVTPVVIDLAAESDSGISNTDNITNDTTPTFTVSQAVHGATVTLTAVRSGQVNRTCTFIADLHSSPQVTSCTFSGSPTSMADGTWTVTAAQTLAPAGKVAATSAVSASQLLYLDTVAPTLTSVSGYSTAYGNFANNATIYGTATADATLTGAFTDAAGYEQGGTCSVDGGPVQQLAANVEGCALIDMTSGTHTAVFTRYDKAGNQSALQTITWTVVNTPSLALAASSDTGASTTDRITADGTPTMQLGDLAPGATVTVTATRTGSTAVTCTFTAPAAVAPATSSSGGCDLGNLVDGTWLVSATQVLGSTSRTASAVSVTVDTTRPVPTAPMIRAGTSTGTLIATESATTATTAWIGAVSPVSGSTLQCRLDGSVVPCPTANTAFTNLAVGSHTFEVIATDAAGNVGITSTTWRILGKPVVTLDPASDTGASSSDRITRDTTPEINVSNLSGGGGTVTVTATRSGSSLTCTFVATAVAGSCTLPTGVDGSWTITATESVRIGASTVNSASADPITVTIDTVAPARPTAALSVGGAAITGGSMVQLGIGVTSGALTFATAPSSEAGATVTCSLDGATASPCPAGGLGTVSNGNHALSMTAVDLAGNESSTIVQWAQVEQMVLGLDPSGNLRTTASGQPITSSRSQTVTLSGLTDAVLPVTVSATNGSQTLTCIVTGQAGGSGSCTLADLADGTWTISADQGITVPPASATLIVDTTQPTLVVAVNERTPTALVAGTAGSTTAFRTSQTTLDLAISAVDAIDSSVSLQCALDAGAVGSCPSSLVGLTYGEHTLVVTATDDAGNTRSATTTWFVSAPPTVTLATASDTGTSSSDGITADSTPTITIGGLGRDVDVVVTASKAGQADVRCYLWHANEAGSVPGTATCDLGSLVDGSWTISATQTISGRPEWTSPVSAPAVVVVDTIAPTAPTSTFTNGITSGSTTTQTALAFSSGPASTDAHSVAYTCELNGGTPTSCGSLAGLTAGTYALRTIATDAAGNTSTSTLSWTVIGPPTVSLATASNSGSTSDTTTNIASPVISVGSLIPGANVTVTATKGSESVTCAFVAGAPAAGSAASTGGCALPGLTSDGGWTVTAVQSIGGTTSTAASAMTLTLDTTSPIMGGGSAGITAVVGSDALPNGGGTDQTSVIFTLPSAEGGTTRTCTIDAVSVACPNSAAALTGFVSGAHELVVTDTDIAGNATAQRFTWAVVGVPVVDLAAASDSASADHVTNDQTPEISVGSLTPGATVEVVATKGTDSVSCSFVASGGIASCDLPPLGDGVWTVKARQGFGSGWSGFSATTTVTVDATAPADLAISVSSGSTAFTFDDDVEMGSASETAAVGAPSSSDASAVTYACALNGGASAPCVASYSSLMSGSNRLVVTATDLAGNTTSLSRTWSVVGRPAITLASASDTGDLGDGVTAEETPSFDVSNLMPGATVTVTATRSGSTPATCTFTAPAAVAPSRSGLGSCALSAPIGGRGWSISAVQSYTTSAADPASVATLVSQGSLPTLLDVVQPHEVVITAPTTVSVTEQVLELESRSVPMAFLSVTLTSLTPSVCSIDADGNVVLLAPGTCTLRGTAPGGDDGAGTYYDVGRRTISFSVLPDETVSTVPAGAVLAANPALVNSGVPSRPAARPQGAGIGGENGAAATTGLRPPPAVTGLRIEPARAGRARVTASVRQDMPGAPVRSVVFMVFNEEGRKIRQSAVDVASGQTSVTTELPVANSRYQVRTFTTNEAGVSNRAPIAANVLNQPTTMGRRPDGTPILFGKEIAKPVLFDPDSPALDARARRTLDGVVAYAAKNGGRVFITGFVRNQGGSKRDQRALSNSRARQVATYLSRRGVDTWIRYDGYGAYREGAGRPRDRRVEVRWSDSEIPSLRSLRAFEPMSGSAHGS